MLLRTNLVINDRTISTSVPVSFSQIRNVYAYESDGLFISYGIAFLLASIAVGGGMASFFRNGVCHSIAFSAILSTTRNPDLDALTTGQSLGTVPLSKAFEKTKLKFGALGTAEAGDVEDGLKTEGIERVAFGIPGTVKTLRKKGLYI